jgi:hypothetical protein
MWSKEGEAHTNVSPDAVWKTWTNADNWPRFDPMIENVTLSPFARGTTGKIKIKGQPRPSPLTISRLDDAARTFEINAPLPLAMMRFEHKVEAAADGTRIWQRTSISGPLSWLWSRVIGRQISAGLPSRLVALGELAGKSAGS